MMRMMLDKKIIKPRTLKGFRDFLPEDMVIRQKVINTLEKVFESYGFKPLETPSLEYSSTLLGKYGEEADKLVYTFKDQGEREVGLIYDLTVPVSKVLALNSSKILLPFKRYQIQRVWRADKPQYGRYREVQMCDIDSFGTTSPLADAEIVAVIYACLKNLNFEKFIVRINSRQVLFKLMSDLGIAKLEQQLSLLQSIDKLDKQLEKAIEIELQQKGMTNTKIKQLFNLIKSAKPDENLLQLFKYLKNLGVDDKFWKFDPTLVRGLDYYTGPIFETKVEKPKIGSITGGGRYDKLISLLGGPDIPATGTTIGLDRICDVIRDQNLWPETLLTSTKVLISIFSLELSDKSIELINKLRGENINCEIYLNPEDRLDKQLKYADKKGIPFVIILGPDEIKNKKATLKDLKTGQQETLTIEQILRKLA